MEFWYLLASAGTVLIAAAILAIFLRKRWLVKMGKQGAGKAARILGRYAFPRGYKVIHQICLPYDGRTVGIDHILIGWFGLIVLLTRDCHGEVYGDESQEEWAYIPAKGQKKQMLRNPLRENQERIDCIRRIFSDEGIYKVPIENLIVFFGKKLQLNIGKQTAVIRLQKLKAHLRKPKYQEDKGVDVERVYQTLMAHAVADEGTASAVGSGWAMEKGSLK